MREFYAHGKLLISGEYLILDGAKGLALPTKKGQKLLVESSKDHQIHWQSYNDQNKLWFSMSCDLNFKNVSTDDKQTSKHLIELLRNAKKLNPDFLIRGARVKTVLEFPRDWGLGSSSTLISTIAQWARINPYQLLKGRFKGSGYDIACAEATSAIVYQLKNNNPSVQDVDFNPEFKEELFFVYLGQKQQSSEQIKAYNSLRFDKKEAIQQIDSFTQAMLLSNNSKDFKELIEKHEALMASILNTTPIKEQFFSDYDGSVKSLGAWGGDFVLLCGSKKTPSYVIEKGFDIVIPFRDMIL